MITITPERLANQAQRRQNVEYASDFYKDVFGYRPNWPYSPTDKDALRAHRAAKQRLDYLKSFPEGRASLRADGWDV